ncbi:MAG: phage tail tube protein [Nitrososphaera sp.]
MSYVPTGHWTQLKKLQYIEETTFGTTPTASPVFSSAGEIESVNENTEIAMKRYRSLGSEDLYQFLKNGQLHSFEVKYQPITSALIKYGTQVQGGGAGTIDKSLSLVYSEDINDIENYLFYRGSRCDQVDVEVTNEAVMVTQNFICKEITTPSTSHGLTTPTFAPANTGTPWTGPDSGSNPFTHNALNYDVDKFKFTVNRALDAIRPNGESLIKFRVPTIRTITGEFDVVRKDAALITDCKNLTARAASYVLKSATSTATFTDMVLIAFATSRPATATEALRDSFKFEAKSISVS